MGKNHEKIHQDIFLEVPPNVVYEKIKNIEKEVNTMIQDFVNLKIQPVLFTEDIPNQRLVHLGRDWTVSLDFAPVGNGSNIGIKAEQTYGIRIGSETLILVWLYALKGMEAGYKSKS